MEPTVEKNEEQIARERVENSPLRFLINRYSGNHSNRTLNTIPKPDERRFCERGGYNKANQDFE